MSEYQIYILGHGYLVWGVSLKIRSVLHHVCYRFVFIIDVNKSYIVYKNDSENVDVCLYQNVDVCLYQLL